MKDIFCNLMILHSNSPKTDHRNAKITSKFLENSFFFYNNIHASRNNSQISFQSVEKKETLWKTQFSFIMMNFHLISAKTDSRNGYTTSKLWENSLFHIHNTIHVATNNSQITFQPVKNEWNTMKNIVFYFDELPLKLS